MNANNRRELKKPQISFRVKRLTDKFTAETQRAQRKATEQFMTKEEVKRIIREYLKTLEEHKIRVKAAYLFGSYIKGTLKKDSDIDLAIISDDFTKDSIRAQLLLMKLRRKVNISIEPHPFLIKDFVDDNPFAREIIKTGKKVR